MTSDRTQVTLADGTVVELSIEMLRSAVASDFPTAGNLRAFALDGRRVELLSLIEAALGVRGGAISAREADRVGREFGLPMIPEARSKPIAPAPYKLRSALARLQGQWVAVVDDEVVAHADTLKELFEATDGVKATIAYVPERAARGGE